jgi:hypothetical protein
MTTLAHSPINDTRFQDLIKDVKAFGKESAEGRDSLPKLAVRIIRAANDGVIDETKGKDGKDDAMRVFEAYAANDGKSIYTRSKDSIKSQASKMRVLIRLGRLTNVDGVVVADRAIEFIKEDKAQDKPAFKPAFAAILDVARAQTNPEHNTVQLSDDEIKEACTKKAPADKDLEGELEAIKKKLQSLVTGEKGLKDDSEQVATAYRAIEERLAALITTRETDEVLSRAAELGLAIAA